MSTQNKDFNRAMELLTSMTAETSESKRVAAAMGEMATDWLTPHYLLALSDRMAAATDDLARFKLMRKAARDVVTFQRSGLSCARLQLDRERLAFKQKVHQDAIETKRQLEERRDPNEPMTEAELKACVDKVDEIFGFKKVQT
ncbi:MAG: hypothetical protein P4N60_05680 [Verrucomicrobiae bacterium]|nr:hypothetical protein [Verrucomicrobiae bacterium]